MHLCVATERFRRMFETMIFKVISFSRYCTSLGGKTPQVTPKGLKCERGAWNQQNKSHPTQIQKSPQHQRTRSWKPHFTRKCNLVKSNKTENYLRIVTRTGNADYIYSDYLWIHRWMAHAAYLKETFKHQNLFNLPGNSQVDGPCSLLSEDLQISMNLRVTCEFTGGWPNQLILPRPSGINESSDYLWIHRWVANSAYLNKSFEYQWIFGLPVNSQVSGPINLS